MIWFEKELELITKMCFPSGPTLLALDFTAPDELTIALLFYLFLHSLITPSTAEESTAIHPITRGITVTTFGSKNSNTEKKISI